MKIRNILTFIFVILIIFASLTLPEMFVKAFSDKIENKTFEISESPSNIDVEAEKIYLVRAIHDIRGDAIKVTISSDSQKYLINNYFESVNSSNIDIVKELEALKQYNILDNFEPESAETVSIGMTNNTYLKENKYIIYNILANFNDIELHLEIEDKTGKIIYIYFNKENFFDGNDEKVLRNFVKYLDLHIIDDWKYSEDLIAQKYYLKSEKAKLVVVLDKSYDKYEISVKLNNF